MLVRPLAGGRWSSRCSALRWAWPATAWRTIPCGALAALQRVSRSEVGIDYFVVDPLTDPASGLQIAQALQVCGVVVVAVVGAHEHIVLARVLEYVGEIIVRLARDVEAIDVHRVLWERTPTL